MIITVQNPTNRLIERGGRIFPPSSFSKEIEVSNYQYFEIKASSSLIVKRVKEEPKENVVPVVDNVDETVDKEEPIEEETEEQEEEPEEEDHSLICEECGFVAKTSSGLSTHTRAKHDGGGE